MGMFAELTARISELQDGIQPDSLRHWHETILSDARDLAPPHLRDTFHLTQDEHLPMKFHLDISKRAVTWYVMAAEGHMDRMPTSTRLYFLNICQMLSSEMDSHLV